MAGKVPSYQTYFIITWLNLFCICPFQPLSFLLLDLESEDPALKLVKLV